MREAEVRQSRTDRQPDLVSAIGQSSMNVHEVILTVLLIGGQWQGEGAPQPPKSGARDRRGLRRSSTATRKPGPRHD